MVQTNAPLVAKTTLSVGAQNDRYGLISLTCVCGTTRTAGRTRHHQCLDCGLFFDLLDPMGIDAFPEAAQLSHTGK